MTNLFDKLERGVEDMKEDNKGFGVKRNGSESLVIQVGSGRGGFNLAAQEHTKSVSFISPLGSVCVYQYDANVDVWKSEADGHDIIELMSRDLVQLCQGYPKF